MSPEKTLVYCLMYILGIGMFLLIMDNMPTSAVMAAWTFTGASFAAAIFPVLPYLFLGAMLLVPSALILKEAG